MISVIVPVYQCEKYLSKCINSILNQTYTELEIILIDDGSIDRSPEICDNFAGMDKRVRVIHQNNRGVSAARNHGLEIANGDYITFVDSDDYLEPDMYERMIEKAEKYTCDVVMCDCVKEFSNQSCIVYSHDIRGGYYNYEQLKHEYYPHLIMMENVEYPATISNWLILFKKELNKVRYVEGVRFSEDLLFGAQLLYYAHSFYYMKGKTFYHYVMNDSSTTHVFKKDKWTDYIKLYTVSSSFFLSEKDYNFQSQLDLMLLFFVYNAVGDVSNTSQLSNYESTKIMQMILSDKQVKAMFERIKIHSLPISWKQKIFTYLYKYKFCFIIKIIKRLT